jgi:hypothetical protein
VSLKFRAQCRGRDGPTSQNIGRGTYESPEPQPQEASQLLINVRQCMHSVSTSPKRRCLQGSAMAEKRSTSPENAMSNRLDTARSRKGSYDRHPYEG